MPLSDIADIQISIAALAPALPGQGLGLLLADVSEDQADAFGSDLTVELAPASWQTTLAGLGFVAANPVWVAISDFYAQRRKPPSVLLGRRDTAVAQVQDVLITTYANGDYLINLEGEVAEVTASGAANPAAIQAPLVSAVNALTLPPGVEVTASAQGVDKVRLTSDNAGSPFLVTVESPGDSMSVVDVTPSYGIVEDLALIRDERDDWYALFGDWRDAANIRVAANYIENLERVYLAQTAAAGANTVGLETDIGSALQALGLARTSVWYSSNSAQWVEGALLGLMLPAIPGSETWAGKSLASVTGDTFATTTGLLGKNYGWLELFNAFVPPRSQTRHGATANGTFLDLLLVRDYLAQQLRICAFEIAQSDIPYSTTGGETVRNLVEQRIRNVGKYTKALDLSTLVVTSTKTKAEQSSEDRAVRKWAGLTFAVVAQGRIHSLGITGTIAP